MKALSVAQPWASVICAGLKDVENRQWQAAQAPGRILIHATKTKVPGNWEDWPDDYVSVIRNARLMGWIPDYRNMPYGSIIGYVDCHAIVKDSVSFWAQPECFHWCLREAWLFDEPIPDIKGVRGHLFEVDVDADNLPPAHKADHIMPSIDGDILTMPAGKEVLELAETGAKDLMYDFDDLFKELFVDPSGNPRSVKKAVFVSGDIKVEREVETIEIGFYTDFEGKPVRYTGIDGQEKDWLYLALVLK